MRDLLLFGLTIPMGHVIFILIELLLLVVLGNGFFTLRRYKRRRADGSYQRQTYAQMLSENRELSFLLVRCHDFYPVFQSPHFEELIGLPIEALRRDIKEIEYAFSKLDTRSFLRQYRAWDGKGVMKFAESVALKDKGFFEVTVTRSEKGDYDLFMLRDVTLENEKINNMELKLIEAENASQSKTTFLSRMSHEIRTPMNGIIGMIMLAQGSINDEKQAVQYLDQAGNLSQFLLALINDILDMSRIEAGKLELENERFDLFAMAEKLRNMFKKNIEEKGVHFAVEMKDFDVRYLMGDELRIMQVLVNFLSNAMKFTSQGEIRVTFRQMIRLDNQINLMVRIHDTGIGMKAEFINHIFKPFEQESTKVTKNYGGSGLGMAIADQLITLMGGKITVNSIPGQGSDFTVFLTLPIAEEGMGEDETAVADTVHEDKKMSIDGAHVLMAEDNHINTVIAVKIMKSMGVDVEVAQNGEEAVSMFSESKPNTYDLILMDIKMPIMDGWQATQNIRALSRDDAKTIPIYALSADAFVEDKRHSIEVGMNGHISKPIDFNELKSTIAKALRRRGGQS